MQSFFGFGPSLDIELLLDGQDTRKTAEIKAEDGKIETHYLYYDGETIGGKVVFVNCALNIAVSLGLGLMCTKFSIRLSTIYAKIVVDLITVNCYHNI